MKIVPKLLALAISATALFSTASSNVDPFRGGSPGSWPPAGVNASFDCGVRALMYEYGKKLIPAQGHFLPLHEALDLDSCVAHRSASISFPSREELQEEAREKTNRDARGVDEISAEASIFVCAERGDDAHDGFTEARPIKSIQLALDRAAKSSTRKTVVLRSGTHFIKDTLRIGAEHSHVTLQSHPDDMSSPIVSGGVYLKNLKWEKFKVDATSNIWVADTKGQVKSMPGLQLNNKRLTRARYPNIPGGIETSCMYGCMVDSSDAAWTPPNFTKFGNVTFYTDSNHAHDRNDSANDGSSPWFQHYMIGIGGLCSVYDPPVSYWCSEHPSGGGAFAFRTPSGVSPKTGALPNSPYKHPEDATFFVWRPARWANWMFNIDSYNVTSNEYTFGHGGFQGARGSNSGGDFFVENVFEELDNPGEFFWDSREDKLYVFHNGTGYPNGQFTVPIKQVLVNITGTQWRPVVGHKITGITFSHTAFTYMEPHGVPSAGDWALERFAAVFLEGTVSSRISSCDFTRLDGNGVMVSGFNRNATVEHSTFEYMGGNAIAAWGYTNETSGDNHPQAGVDGTDGNHPRYTTIVSNVAREVGLYEKQSSFFVQAKTAQSIIKGNVFFNGPRAGINANDGFGGGDELTNNLVFSTCRESGDHGPFNSWDRQPFLTTVRTGEPSMQMQWREIHHNFFMDNYSPQENVDNDDGSAYYKTHDNVFIYGGRGMKNDFGGHDNHHYDNIYAYVGGGMGDGAQQLEGHEDQFYGNHVVMTGTDVGSMQCGAPGKSVVHDNAYYTPTGAVTECGKKLADWQAAGNDKGSAVYSLPSDEEIFGWIRQKLGM